MINPDYIINEYSIVLVVMGNFCLHFCLHFCHLHKGIVF